MARNNIIVYINDTAKSAIIESKQGVLLFQNDTVFEIDVNFLRSLKGQYSKYYEAYCCLGLHKILFGTKMAYFLIIVTNCSSIGKLNNHEIFKILSTHFICINSNISYEEDYSGITEIKKFLNSGNFYFSLNDHKELLDLTLNTQNLGSAGEPDSKFFWNKVPFSYLTQNGVNNAHKWFAISICGSFEIKTCYAGNKKAKLCLISRYGCERAGTRFNVRGIDDNGFVANFVETEQVIYLNDEAVSSYVQIRGSVPLFWEQTGFQVGAHKVQLSRGFEASSPAFNRHMYLLTKLYKNIVLLNLMGNKEGEKMLTEAYESQHRASPFNSRIPLVHFDYHANCRNSKHAQEALNKLWEQSIWPNLIKSLDVNAVDDDRSSSLLRSTQYTTDGLSYLGAYTSPQLNIPKNISRQNVVIRTNCVDCIDRTNACQTFIARQVLPYQLKALGITDKNHFARFDEMFRAMWISNGDKLSNIYAGTGALECKGKIKEGALSVTRTIQSNFLDESRQLAMDLLLLNSSHTHYLKYVQTIFPIDVNWVSNELVETLYYWYKEITEPRTLRVFIGTWNVNGGKILTTQDTDNLSEWLTAPIYKTSFKKSPLNKCDEITPDIYIIGFQEIIDLNAKNIAISNIENQKFWEIEIHNILCLKGRYASVVTSQLVGVCVYVFANELVVHSIRNISVTKIKTGLGGTAGNKGGICVHFTYGSNIYSFVCAHLAAGQSQVRERNSDFAEISTKINPIVCYSDYYFWFGDFNYRIDMPIDNVKDYVRDKRWDQLMAAEQLTLQKSHDLVFKEFNEAPVTFAPTYKYDLNSESYDTSDKSRIPAWTDRILWKARPRPGFKVTPKQESSNNNHLPAKSCDILVYDRAELKSSDHRPVYAIFDTEVNVIEHFLLAKNFESIVIAGGPLDRSIRIYIQIVHHEINDDSNYGTNSKDDMLETEIELTEDDFDDNDLKHIYQSLYDTLVSNAGEIVWLRFDQTVLSIDEPNLARALKKSYKSSHHNQGQDGGKPYIPNPKTNASSSTDKRLVYLYGLTCTFSKGYSAVYAIERLDNTTLLNPKLPVPASNGNTSNLTNKSILLHVCPSNMEWIQESRQKLSNLVDSNRYLTMTGELFNKNFKDFAPLFAVDKDKTSAFLSPDMTEVFDHDIGLDTLTDPNIDLKSTNNLVQSYYDLYQRRPTLKEELISQTVSPPLGEYAIDTADDIKDITLRSRDLRITTESGNLPPTAHGADTMKWTDRLSLTTPLTGNLLVKRNSSKNSNTEMIDPFSTKNIPPSRPPPPKIFPPNFGKPANSVFFETMNSVDSHTTTTATTTSTVSLLDLDDFPSTVISSNNNLSLNYPDTEYSFHQNYSKEAFNSFSTPYTPNSESINERCIQENDENGSLTNQLFLQSSSTFYANNAITPFDNTSSYQPNPQFTLNNNLNQLSKESNGDAYFKNILLPPPPSIPLKRSKMGPPRI